MYNMLRAATLEADAQARKVKSQPGAKAVWDAVGVGREMYYEALARAGSTEVGSGVGDGARKIGAFLSSIPIISAPNSVIRAYSCVDKALENAATSSADPLRRVQVAEAFNNYLAYRRASFVLRHAADPSALVTSTLLRQVARLGTDLGSPVERQVANAYRLIRNKQATGQALSFEDHLALSRLYRVAAQPKLAVQHGIMAAKLAGSARAALAPEPRTDDRLLEALFEDGIGGFLGELGGMFEEALDEVVDRTFARIEARVDGDISGFDMSDQLRIMEGAGWSAAGYGLVDGGNLSQARKAGDRAIRLGFTVGYDVLAAAHESDTWFGPRILERFEIMEGNVTPSDRMYFHGGAWRGSVVAGFSAGAEQVDKALTLLNRILDNGDTPPAISA